MIFFKNSVIFMTDHTEEFNEIGQSIKRYVKADEYQVNIQPIEEKQVQRTWGGDIESTYQMYFDELLETGDVISWNDKAYEIEKVIDWGNYRLYAIKEVDVIINDI